MSWFWFYLWLLCTPLAFLAGRYTVTHAAETAALRAKVSDAFARLFTRITGR